MKAPDQIFIPSMPSGRLCTFWEEKKVEDTDVEYLNAQLVEECFTELQSILRNAPDNLQGMSDSLKNMLAKLKELKEKIV